MKEEDFLKLIEKGSYCLKTVMIGGNNYSEIQLLHNLDIVFAKIYVLNSEIETAKGHSECVDVLVKNFIGYLDNNIDKNIYMSENFIAVNGSNYFSKKVSLWNKILIYLFIRD